MRVLLKTLVAFLLGLLITGAMLFLPAGTWDYHGAWLFMALLFTPILMMGIVLMIKNPELLRKGLPGYVEYTHRVRYCMIPFVW